MPTEKATYKNVNIPRELLPLIPFMPDVEAYREELNTLVSQWDLLTILGQMSAADTDMTATRSEFQSLTNDLLGHLGMETLKKAVQETSSIAQVAVDILIRNLFERTADIGFLATDDDIRNFVKQSAQDGVNPEARRALTQRFQEYVAKYSVYHNIILLDVEGRVLAQLDENSKIEVSSDPLIQEALITTDEYIECFRETDLDSESGNSLIYAFRVSESNDSQSKALGVLCLCFRFEDEMKGIFSDLLDEDDWSIITILDEKGQVIASSDPYQVPCGAIMERELQGDYKLVRFAGNEFLAKTCATKGYQGFMGLGWQGHVLLPLRYAFQSKNQASLLERIDPNILSSVMQDPRLFSEELRQIPLTADAIQKDLNRTIWNGNIRETTQQSKVLLWNIAASGEKTKQVFEASIGNLHQTVISAILQDATFRASLAVDIMDRNLYERANDCRWWALTSDFRSILDQASISESESEAVSSILKYINDLYTVYTNLFVYDKDGKVIAVSNPSEEQLVGRTLKSEWVAQTLQLKDTQSYSVSDFEATPLYGGKHSYIYGASILAPGDHSKVVGGIGIVFDSEPQFEAMLEDCLPRDTQGNPMPDAFALFCDRDLNVVSSSHSELPVGSRFDLKIHLDSLNLDEGDSSILAFKGQYYAVGVRKSSGYREYKCSDNYENEIIALIFYPLANVEAESDKKTQQIKTPDLDFKAASDESSLDIATFRIGESTYGLPTKCVHKAMDIEGMTKIPGSHPLLFGKIVDEGQAVPVIDFPQLYTEQPSELKDGAQLLLLKGSKGPMGLIIDELGPIPSVPESKIDFNATLLDFADKFTQGVLLPAQASNHSEMVVILDADRLQEFLHSEGTFNIRKREGEATPPKATPEHHQPNAKELTTTEI